jgi:putative phage-type endonuclease
MADVLPQNQQDHFHTTRKSGIGGSDIPVLLGLSKWKTPYQLWMEKTGRVQSKDISHLPHVKRGIDGEIPAREKLGELYATKFTPGFWTDDVYAFMRCSCDGTTEDKKYTTEIKCMNVDNHELTARGEIPEMYRAQLLWNMSLTKAETGLFVSYWPEDGSLHVVEVKFDLPFIKNARKVAKDFWLNHVMTDTPPPMVNGDYVKIEDKSFDELSMKWLSAKEKLAQASEELEAAEELLKAFVTDETPGIAGHLVKVARQVRRGNIDYKVIPELAKVDCEKYRKPSVTSVVVRPILVDRNLEIGF